MRAGYTSRIPDHGGSRRYVVHYNCSGADGCSLPYVNASNDDGVGTNKYIIFNDWGDGRSVGDAYSHVLVDDAAMSYLRGSMNGDSIGVWQEEIAVITTS